jgi:hypothetical protein
MSQIQISLEGTSAIALAEALKGLPGFEVTVKVGDPTEVVRGENLDRALITFTLVTGTVGLLSDSISIIKASQPEPIQSALIVSDTGKRVSLKNATPQQILEILKSME